MKSVSKLVGQRFAFNGDMPQPTSDIHLMYSQIDLASVRQQLVGRVQMEVWPLMGRVGADATLLISNTTKHHKL